MQDLEKALRLSKGAIPFTENDIILFTDNKNEPIYDLRTTEQNQDSVKLFYDEIRRWTSDSSNRITSTITGGRKPLSVQMALAFQLFARKHDELIHIIAPDDKMDPKKSESQSWFFPNNPKDPSEKLHVSHVPVLRVGRYLSSNLNLPPSQLIDTLQNELVEHAQIDELVVGGKSFISSDEKFVLSPLLASYMRYFIRRRMNSRCDRSCRGCVKCFVKNSDLPELTKGEILSDHRTLYKSWSGYYEKTKNVRENATVFELIDFIKSDISRLKITMRKLSISNRFKNSLQIQSLALEHGNRQLKWHGVILDPEIIRIEK